MSDTSEHTNIVRLPDATRQEQIERWGLDDTQRWEGVSRRGYGPEGDEPQSEHSLGTTDISMEERAYLSENRGAWSVAWAGSAEYSGGLRASRGVIEEGAFVDPEVLRFGIEARLGFTSDQVLSVYRQGPLSVEDRALRDRIDARFLALHQDGINMAMLARVLGLAVKDNNTCRTLENALRRAREAGA